LGGTAWRQPWGPSFGALPLKKLEAPLFAGGAAGQPKAAFGGAAREEPEGALPLQSASDQPVADLGCAGPHEAANGLS
jgi:hypothetical protein